MNFELIDNIGQVVVLLLCATAAGMISLKRSDRRLFVLALAYTTFAMGTAFYVLHILIVGDIPRIFYVSEVSWMAAYFLFLSLCFLRSEPSMMRFSIVAMVLTLIVAYDFIHYQLFGTSLVMSVIFTIPTGLITYISALKLTRKETRKPLDALMLVLVALQIALYITSAFTEDFTRFNAYFAIDMLLTALLVAFLPLLLSELEE